MRVYNFTYKPKFVKKEASGRYSPKLFMGFEDEMVCAVERYNDYIDDINKDFDNLLYAKKDMSVNAVSCTTYGMELNTHPFNWNWLLKNHEFLDKIEAMRDMRQNFTKKATVNRTCGFHIHLNKNYFTGIHALKMAKFFYANPLFIKNISLRGNTSAFNMYSSPILSNDEKRALFNEKIVPSYNRQQAINFMNRKTIEIRIFQGTLYKETILSYLEFAHAVTMFTKKFSWKNMTKDKFISYVYKSSNSYSHLVKLIEGKLQWK